MPYDPITASQKARFIQFAYNMFSGNPASLTPPVDPGLATAGYDLVFYLTAKDFQSVKFYGYVAAATADPGDIVVAIRGTETFTEWLLDFDALPLPYLGKGLVADGFRLIAESYQLTTPAGAAVGNLTAALAARNAATPITNITVLGHSLGGALATLAAAQIAFSGAAATIPLTLWTYASPRVAFPDFMSAFNTAVPNSYRIWNSLDIVPEVPVFPYVHVGQSEQLKQTQAQIQKLKVSSPCEHHLTTYEWLLDPANFQLDTDCQLAAPLVLAAHAVGAPVAAAPVTEASAGAAALAHGLLQHP
jgi:hypothetical protein